MKKLKTKAPLSYFGSDAAVAKELAKLLNHCKHVTIPFCGGMSILPWLDAMHVVANDMNELAIDFYRVLSGYSGNADELQRMCEYTLTHPSELERARSLIESDVPTARAWAYWAQCWLGRKGKTGTNGEGKGMPSVRRTPTGGANASRIVSAAADLESWAGHFQRCEWTCEDFRVCLSKVADDVQCAVYCDAPWIDDGDGYIHNFTMQDHIDLLYCVERFTKATVVIRYGDHPTVRELYAGCRIIEASSRTQTNAVKGELWITNKS